MRATVLVMNPEKPSAPSWKRVAATSVSASSRTLMRPVIMSSRMNAVAEKPARSVRSRSKKAATCGPDGPRSISAISSAGARVNSSRAAQRCSAASKSTSWRCLAWSSNGTG